jgi:hypothetical protein
VNETAPTTLADACPPLAEGEVSDDETPSIAGTMARAKAGTWLETRGISREAFRAWIRSRGPFEDTDADDLFDDDEACATLKVGDKSEDALACPLTTRTMLERESAAVLVVRDKRIVPVLEVGHALRPMAILVTPERWLDLQLTFAPGGLEADVHDRAKPGAVLLRSPSRCHEDYARYLACEKAQRDGVATETMCPSVNQTSIGDWPMPEPPDRVELYGCAAALSKIGKVVRAMAVDPSSSYTTEELRDDRAFVVKSCAARGRYTWKAGRFVRSSSGAR